MTLRPQTGNPMPDVEIVASAENNAYMEWQAMLFHFSCVTNQGQVPIIAVHRGDEPLLPGFQMIVEHGGRIQSVPNFRDLNRVSYAPRNSAAALRFVETSADFVVLCDADMLFLKPIPFQSIPLGRNTITFDYVGYLNPDLPVYQPQIDDVFRENGIDPMVLRRPLINGGVPHIVSSHLHQAVGEEWLRCIDLFPILFEGERPDSQEERYADWPYRCYLASMWAMVMARHTLQLEHCETRLVMSNHDDFQRMPDRKDTQASMLHYTYGSAAFDKRNVFVDHPPTDAEFWDVPAADDSIAGYLRTQFRKAGRFYGLL